MGDPFNTSYEDPDKGHHYGSEPEPYRYDADHSDKPLAQFFQVVPPPPPDFRKQLMRWLILSSCVVLIMLLSAGGLRLWSYLNRSTPSRTLDEFCAALQKEDYASAYSTFTKSMQASFPERNFAGILAQDKVASCSHGDASEAISPAITSLRLIHASHQINNDVVTLTKDQEDIWRINDVRRASSAKVLTGYYHKRLSPIRLIPHRRHLKKAWEY